jgi:hypothetical protein
LIFNGVIFQKSDYKKLYTIMENAFKSLAIKDKPVDADDFKDSTGNAKPKQKDD